MSATEAVYVYRDNARTAAPHGAWRYRHILGDCILADEVLAAPVHATTREAIDAARRIYPDAIIERATVAPAASRRLVVSIIDGEQHAETTLPMAMRCNEDDDAMQLALQTIAEAALRSNRSIQRAVDLGAGGVVAIRAEVRP